jgi:hypothetical protein
MDIHNQVQAASDHFCQLYAEEIHNNEVTEDTIYEWWTQTRDQYEGVEYEDVEQAILERI